jgi:hypothetical protein
MTGFIAFAQSYSHQFELRCSLFFQSACRSPQRKSHMFSSDGSVLGFAVSTFQLGLLAKLAAFSIASLLTLRNPK